MALARQSLPQQKSTRNPDMNAVWGRAEVYRPILVGPPGHFWQIQILALAQGCWQPVSNVTAGPGAAALVPCSHCLGEELYLLRHSLTTNGGLDWLMLRGPIPGTVVVWSWNQVARVPCSVAEKQQKAKETPEGPPPHPQSSQCPGLAETHQGGRGGRRATLSGLELEFWRSCLKGNETGFWGSPLPCGGGSFF